MLMYWLYMFMGFLGGCCSIFMYLQSPLSMAVVIVASSFLISISMYLMSSVSWFSYLLFMVFLSGMMIIFIYVSSLASNEISFPSIFMSPFVILFLMMSYFFSFFLFSPSFLLNLNFSSDSLFCYKIYSGFMFVLTMMMILYLLVALLVVVKNSLFSEGPLRSKT